MDSIATFAGYFSCAFILLPAGRDIFAQETPILPGEENNLKMMTASSPKARTLTWGMWGLNHCALSILKCYAIFKGDKPLIGFLAGTAAITLGYLVKERKKFIEGGGDIDGFVVICGLQTVSLGFLAV